jgi:pimeloyl-ACP methyl ester carboxylesterase
VVREAQLRAAGRLAGEAVAGVVSIVGDVQRTVTRRVQGELPPPGGRVAAVQSGIADLVLSCVALGGRITPVLVAEVLARSGAPAVSETTVGRHAVAAINGMWGDTIAAHHPALAVAAALRVRGENLGLDPGSVAAAFPEPTRRIVVFVHGLTESDRSWWKGWADERPSTPPSYGDRLHTELGYTAVYFHYNSGLRVSHNGRALAEVLDRLVEVWPVPVEEIALVGHSMGGLLARSACHYGELEGQPWVPLVRTVVTLGTPHLGAPLEKAAHLAERLLAKVPESEPFARLLAGRSLGVQDMRHGSVVEADWRGQERAGLLGDPCADVPFLETATYCFMAASIVRDPRHPAGRLLGDGLVRYPSAAGTGGTRRVPFTPENGAHFPGLHHFSLLNHPDVYAQLKTWLDTA